jgi:hypothetical protein
VAQPAPAGPPATPALSGAPEPWLAATGWATVSGCPLWPVGGWLGHGGKAADAACPAASCGFYARAEFLLWWLKSDPVPPLVTQGSSLLPPDTGAENVPNPGALGMPSTVVLLGGTIDPEEHSGGRFTVGQRFGAEQTFGLEANFFFLAHRGTNFRSGQDGSPGPTVLSRPFFDVQAMAEDAEVVAFPGEKAGNVSVSLTSQLLGAEANARVALFTGACCRLDLIGGYRYLQLDENLRIVESITSVPIDVGNTFLRVLDEFSTHNQFHGGQLGGEAEFVHGRWALELRGQVAWGLATEVVNIRGNTQVTNPFRDDTFNGGLLALPTNSGRHSRTRSAVVPEVGINVGWQITDHLRASLGYTFLYWSQVARPGEAIDRGINPSQLASEFGPGMLVGPARPAFAFKDTDFWAQGINFSVEFRY